MSDRCCPKCLQLLEPLKPFSYPNQDRQLEVRLDEYRPGCRTEHKVIGEGRFARTEDRYYMLMWECVTEGCPKRGGIAQHLTLEATVSDPNAHTEPRRHDADNPTLAP